MNVGDLVKDKETGSYGVVIQIFLPTEHRLHSSVSVFVDGFLDFVMEDYLEGV